MRRFPESERIRKALSQGVGNIEPAVRGQKSIPLSPQKTPVAELIEQDFGLLEQLAGERELKLKFELREIKPGKGANPQE